MCFHSQLCKKLGEYYIKKLGGCHYIMLWHHFEPVRTKAKLLCISQRDSWGKQIFLFYSTSLQSNVFTKNQTEQNKSELQGRQWLTPPPPTCCPTRFNTNVNIVRTELSAQPRGINSTLHNCANHMIKTLLNCSAI